MYPSPYHPGSAYQHTFRVSERPDTVYESPHHQQMTDVSHPTEISHCSSPIRFASGQFAGKTIRSELCEIQKANTGRKYARVDRRPLDPPPVVKLNFHEVTGPNSGRKIPYQEIETLGILCTVDLFPVDYADGTPARPDLRKSDSYSPSSSKASASPHSPTSFAHQSYASAYPGYAAGVPSDIVHWVGNHPVTESSKMTDALVGATFVQPLFIDYEGTKTLIFVFSDLAVKNEGYFILRYRMFDIFAGVEGQNERIVQAECYGGLFRVYSTKEFPGLPASTELTKLIARYGARLNIRETERKRRKKGELAPTEAMPASSRRGKRKQSSPDNDSDDEDEGVY